jgi:ribonucleotide reductase beta subunit family protein with ferritin-like domain
MPEEYKQAPTNLLVASSIYRPMRYPWAYEAWLQQQRLHWLPEEVPLGDDVREWHRVITDSERNLLTQIFRFFTLSDVEVSNCYKKGTQILTSDGWRKFEDLPEDALVAQVNSLGETEFVQTVGRTSHLAQSLVRIHSERGFDLTVTSDHDMVVRHKKTGVLGKVKASSYPNNQNIATPVVGPSSAAGGGLSYRERMLVAYQANGSKIKFSGSRKTSHRMVFVLKKERKLERLVWLARKCGYPFDVSVPNKKGATTVTVTFPEAAGLVGTKNFTWIDLGSRSRLWCEEFVEEISLWDGYVGPSGSIQYGTKSKSAADTVQAVAFLAGKKSKLIEIDGKWQKEYNVVSISSRTEICTDSLKRYTFSPEGGEMVYCVTVPSGMIVVRDNGMPLVSGNCYNRFYSQIFKPIEVSMMLTAFSNMESVHVAAYSHLLDTIGMPETEYAAFLGYKEMKDKFDYMQSFNVSDKRNVALTLAAFGAFTEGVQLFASFAILLNFPRHGKMKGMGQIIAWSVRDECFAEETEILTPAGWVDLADLRDGEEVAQWDMGTGEVSFVAPSRRVEYEVDKEMVEFSAEKAALGFLVTPSHGVIYESQGGKPGGRRRSAETFVPGGGRRIPVSGRKLGGRREMTALERFRVALAAYGDLEVFQGSPRRPGTKAECLYVAAVVKKKKKIEHLHRILIAAGLSYSVRPWDGDGTSYFHISAPSDISKDLCDWVVPGDVSASWCDDFFEELAMWGGDGGDGAVDLIQALCAISGRSSKTAMVPNPLGDDGVRRRVSTEFRTSIGTGSLRKRYVPYRGKVRCVTVPTGAVVVRYKGNVQVSGNSLHCVSVIKLFRTFVEENREIWTDDLKRDIYACCETIVEHEDAFIDLAFEQGSLENLTAVDVKRYIRYIADRRLTQLGMHTIYEIEDNPLPWLDEMLNAVEHTNFFENRATEYSRASTTGSWDDAFKMHGTIGPA